MESRCEVILTLLTHFLTEISHWSRNGNNFGELKSVSPGANARFRDGAGKAHEFSELFFQ